MIFSLFSLVFEYSIYLLTPLFAYYLYYNFYGKRKDLPPGPTPLPILGNLLMIDQNNLHKIFIELSKKYGSIYTFWFGSEPNVVITDFQLIKQALVKQGDVFAGRPSNYVFEILQALGEGRAPFMYGVIFATGDFWKEQRRFALHVLRDFGFGKNIMEEKIMVEVNHLVQHIRDLLEGQRSKGIDVNWPVQLCVGSIISTILMGHRYERDDPKFRELKFYLDEQLRLFSSLKVGLLMVYPWLRFIPLFGRFGYTEFENEQMAFYRFMKSEVDNHKANFTDTTAEPTDFTEAYLREMKRRREVGEDMSGFTEHQLAAILLDLWGAGMETTVTTLTWGFLFMIYHPEVQEKCRKEIMDVLADREPRVLTMADRQNMPFTAATIQEMQRLGNILPIIIQHSTTEDTTFSGYTLKRGTTILPQISAVLADPSIYPNPSQFNPNRFLTPDGTSLLKSEELIPFSMGKRLCLGESLARAELFLIFTSLIEKFKFAPVDENNLPSLEPVGGFTLKAQPYKVLVTEL